MKCLKAFDCVELPPLLHGGHAKYFNHDIAAPAMPPPQCLLAYPLWRTLAPPRPCDDHLSGSDSIAVLIVGRHANTGAALRLGYVGWRQPFGDYIPKIIGRRPTIRRCNI
jgi:hypothetical protein